MITIRLVDARRALNKKCMELFNNEKIADAIYRYLCDGIEECEDAEPERKTGKWTTEQVAEILANLFGDECACNCNDIDEWLPSACKYADTQCPDPKEKHGCWMQFLIQGGVGTGE